MNIFRSKKILFTTFIVVALLVAFGWYQMYQNLQNKPKDNPPITATETEDTPIAGSLDLLVLSEPVFIQLPNSTAEAEIREAVEVKAGTIVRTGETGRAELRYPNKSVTRLNFNTTLEVEQIDEQPQNSILRLIQGSIWNRVAKLLGRETFSTRTETMVATVRGTAYRMGILEDGTNVVMVQDGEVNVGIQEEEPVQMTENKRMTYLPESDEDPLIEDYDIEAGADDWTLFNLEQDEQWMEENSASFEDDVLGASTENTEEEDAVTEPATPTPVLINCTGPDGVQFRSSRQDCDNLNNFWKSVNPPQSNNNSNNNSNTKPTNTPVPPTPTTAVPTLEPTSAVPTVTPAPDYEIFAVCVILNTDGSYIAFFDYRLNKDTPVFLFISKIEGGEGSPPSTLTPNNSGNLIRAIGKQGTPISWLADNYIATATTATPACETTQGGPSRVESLPQ